MKSIDQLNNGMITSLFCGIEVWKIVLVLGPGLSQWFSLVLLLSDVMQVVCLHLTPSLLLPRALLAALLLALRPSFLPVVLKDVIYVLHIYHKSHVQMRARPAIFPRRLGFRSTEETERYNSSCRVIMFKSNVAICRFENGNYVKLTTKRQDVGTRDTKNQSICG